MKQKRFHEVHSWLCSVAAKPHHHTGIFTIYVSSSTEEKMPWYVPSFPKTCVRCSKNCFFFSLRESYIQSLQKRMHHPQRKRRRKKQQQQQNTTFIEAHQLIGILPPSICTSPPQSWQPKASLLPLWWQQRNRDHATVAHHYRAARNRSSHKWNHSLGGQWNKIRSVT